MAGAPLLEVRDLSVSYDTPYGPIEAVSRVSLSIQPAEGVGLVGESGSGKSTIAAAILDLLAPEARVDGGVIVFEGQDLSRLGKTARRKLLGDRIGAVFQSPGTCLNPSIRVGRQIAEPLEQHRGLSRGGALGRARELLAELGITRTRDVAQAYPHQLSGGMQQRALIAAAIACEPSLLILDEPTTALDVTVEAQLLDLLEELKARHRLSLLYISHSLAVVSRLCDHVGVLYAGQLMERGSAAELFKAPVHPYTKGLLASLPTVSVDWRSRRLQPIPGRLPDLTEPPPGCLFEPRCPFRHDRCAREPQVDVRISDHWVARCWRAHDVAGFAWTAPAGDGGSSARAPAGSVRQRDGAPGAPLLRGRDVRKVFRIGGFWASIHLAVSEGGRLRFRYEPRRLAAVDGVSLEIAAGEVLGLVGESGSGKTTLGRCLLHLLDPTSGIIEFEGRRLGDLTDEEIRAFRRRAQIVFQNPDSSLNPRKRVGEILGRPLELFRVMDPARIPARVRELLQLVKLPVAYAERLPHQLSGGEKQRVGIARALASSPRFVVCDEAVSALDASLQAGIVNLLSDLRAELGVSLLFISHDLSVVSYLADRIAVMYHGRLCEVGPTSAVLQPPYHPYTQALLSAVPRLDVGEGRAERLRLRDAPPDLLPDGRGCPFKARCPIKLGPVCDEEPPPAVAAGREHVIYCHHPLDVLGRLESVVPDCGVAPAVRE
ncbi:MAG TPA: ABC transporter ATP-binding protein [Methylomirabilota bacterium]|jgi:peptide/nickel transport system ATP-binding protein|nr:ABC transporter ATP-binding protein [Methylomirabilota bacterium]